MTSPDPDERALRAMQTSCDPLVYGALDQLTLTQRQVLERVHLFGDSPGDAAMHLHMSERTLRRQLSAAKRRLGLLG